MVLATLLGAVGGGVLLVWFLNYFPKPVERARISCQARDLGKLPVDKSFQLLSWNIQYGAGREYHFFYDGGRAVRVACRDVRKTCSRMAGLVANLDPDFLLLQEVDRDSARTCRLDELGFFRRALPPGCWTWTPYHRSRFVPVPVTRPLGRVDMHLVAYGKYRMTTARRIALPLLRESALRRAFNLKRAVLEAHVALSDGRTLVLLNTHLSAFSRGDGTLRRQVGRLVSLLEDLDRRRLPWILAGDFNMLPPGDDPSRLGRDARDYADDPNPIQELFDRFQPALDLNVYRRRPEDWYTYLPFGALRPDRTLDYVFASHLVEIERFRVVSEWPDLSDHRPLLIQARIRPLHP